MHITEKDVGRKVVTRGGEEGVITYFESPSNATLVEVFFEDINIHRVYARNGLLVPNGGGHPKDLAGWADDEQNETKELDMSNATNRYTEDTLTRAVLEEGVKLRIKSEEHNEAFQAKCFELGVSWRSSGSSRVLPLSVGTYIFVKRDAETGRPVMTWGGAKDAPHFRRIFYHHKREGKKMKYEPFDLERALSGDPVVLRNGAKAYVRHYEKELDALFPLIGYIVNDRGKVEDVCSWKDDRPNVKGAYPNLEDGTDIVGMYPQNKVVHGVEVPAFPHLEPKENKVYYAPSIIDEGFYHSVFWDGSKYVKTLWERGLLYPFTKRGRQAAILHAKVLLGLVGKYDDCTMSVVKDHSGASWTACGQRNRWKEWKPINEP